MMPLIKLILFALVGHILFSSISSDYLHQILPANLFNNAGFNFSIIIETSPGIIIYAIDSNSDKLLIEIVKKEFNENVIKIKFKDLSANETTKNLCQCDTCSKIYMKIILQLNQSEIIIICQGKFKLLKLEKINSKVDRFESYPNKKDFYLNSNKTSVMIGNIGYYKGFGSKIYQANKHQIEGCLNKFFFNGNIINFNPNGTKIKLFCPNKYKEIICKDINCSEKYVSYDVDDCSLEAINLRYCNQDLQLFSNSNNSFHFNKNIKGPNLLRIEWKPLFIRHYCLLEIELRNETFVLFHMNIYGEVLINIKYRQSIINEKILTKLSFNDINILFINFHHPNFIIKILNKDNIYTFIDEFIDYPILFNAGMSKSFNICETFVGAFKVRFDPKQINDSIKFSQIKTKLKSESNNCSSSSVNSITINAVSIVLTIMFWALVICVFKYLQICKIKIMKNYRNKSVTSSQNNSNDYENIQIRNL